MNTTRIPHDPCDKGSERWIQHLVNRNPGILDAAIGIGEIDWRSPCESDDFAEYLDEGFVDLLGLTLGQRPLATFWPRSGPRWDALGISASGTAVLVEAKANVPEVFSPPTRSGGNSNDLIRASLDEVKGALRAHPGTDWSLRFFQYANRLAHAYLLQELNGIPAVMVFVYFIGDVDTNGPTARREWESVIATLQEALGLTGRVPSYVRDAFIDVRGDTPVVA